MAMTAARSAIDTPSNNGLGAASQGGVNDIQDPVVINGFKHNWDVPAPGDMSPTQYRTGILQLKKFLAFAEANFIVTKEVIAEKTAVQPRQRIRPLTNADVLAREIIHRLVEKGVEATSLYLDKSSPKKEDIEELNEARVLFHQLYRIRKKVNCLYLNLPEIHRDYYSDPYFQKQKYFLRERIVGLLDYFERSRFFPQLQTIDITNTTESQYYSDYNANIPAHLHGYFPNLIPVYFTIESVRAIFAKNFPKIAIMVDGRS